MCGVLHGARMTAWLSLSAAKVTLSTEGGGVVLWGVAWGTRDGVAALIGSMTLP